MSAIDRYTHTLEAYQQVRQQFFPTLHSLRWFVHQHRQELLAGGAFIAPVKNYLVYPAGFDAVVETIGQRRVEQAAAADIGGNRRAEAAAA
jgi:hypothetical protein